jgi:hypothetical protein
MARESRRKREEKRFGRPERLADRLFQEPFVPVPWRAGLALPEDWNGVADNKQASLLDEVARSQVVVADNVHDFFVENPPSGQHLREYFAVCVPPFESTFVEFKRCEQYIMQLQYGEMYHVKGNLDSWGWSIHLTDYGVDSDVAGVLGDLLGADVPEGLKIRFFVSGDLVTGLNGKGTSLVCGPTATVFAFLDDNGFLHPNLVHVDLPYKDNLDEETKTRYMDRSLMLFAPVLLTFTFMNTKGITVSTVRPEPTINAERKKNGRRSFVRYRTIGIEPLTDRSKSLGDSGQNMMKKGLHLCRSHFATYVPENGFMGRKLDKPLNVFRRSHVRGSAKQGVVFSDYNVKAPKEGDEGT